MLESEKTVILESLDNVDNFIRNVCPPTDTVDSFDTLKAFILKVTK